MLKTPCCGTSVAVCTPTLLRCREKHTLSSCTSFFLSFSHSDTIVSSTQPLEVRKAALRHQTQSLKSNFGCIYRKFSKSGDKFKLFFLRCGDIRAPFAFHGSVYALINILSRIGASFILFEFTCGRVPPAACWRGGVPAPRVRCTVPGRDTNGKYIEH